MNWINLNYKDICLNYALLRLVELCANFVIWLLITCLACAYLLAHLQNITVPLYLFWKIPALDTSRLSNTCYRLPSLRNMVMSLLCPMPLYIFFLTMVFCFFEHFINHMLFCWIRYTFLMFATSNSPPLSLFFFL